MLCAESEFEENFEEHLDVITPEKCIISNSNETSKIQDSDTNDDFMSL